MSCFFWANHESIDDLMDGIIGPSLAAVLPSLRQRNGKQIGLLSLPCMHGGC